MELLGTVDWSGRIFSGGWVEGGGQTYSAVEPATGQTLGQVGSASAADVDRAVGLGREAQPLWAAMSYQARARSPWMLPGKSYCPTGHLMVGRLVFTTRGGATEPTTCRGAVTQPLRVD